MALKQKNRNPQPPSYKGGKTHHRSGYVVEQCPDHPAACKQGYVYQHRLVVEDSIGRHLNRSEHVHHKDENRANNELGNLELMSSKNHALQHNCDHHAIGHLRDGRTRHRQSGAQHARVD